MDQEPRADSTPREGDVLAGKYRIEKVLGAGGMGVVVAAQHLHLEERVAIKYLLPEATSDPEVLARFSREARAAVKIKSEHVARVADVGTFENGAPYMVMEYLEGADMTTWLQEYGPLSVEEATEFVLQAAEAIAEAHALGIVHRDLKPSNLFVTRRRDGKLSVKVLDFGISKVTGAARSSRDKALTRTRTVMGTPLYMAPEQMESARNADARSDIWSLGVILYELVANYPPFDGESMPELLNHVLHRAPPPLAEYRGQLPDGFESVVLKCLEKSPDQRFQDVAEFATALSEFALPSAQISVERISSVLRASGVVAHVSFPRASQAVSGHSKTAATWGTTAPVHARGGRKSLLIAGAVIAIGVVGTLVYFAERGRTGTQASAQSSAAMAPLATSAKSERSPAPGTESSSPAAEASSAPIVTMATEQPSASAPQPSAPVKHVVHRVHRARVRLPPRPAAHTQPAAHTRSSGTPSDVYSDRK